MYIYSCSLYISVPTAMILVAHSFEIEIELLYILTVICGTKPLIWKP